jgi:outer membrane protein OmpA-like peptidoglycan-associated protein
MNIKSLFVIIASLLLLASCAGQHSTSGLVMDASGGCIQPVEPAKIAVIKEKVLFDFDSYKLDAEATTTVEKVAAVMKANPDTQLILEGYTDKYGSVDYNLTLSMNRAKAVKNALVANGVPADKIAKIEGFGKSKLIPNLSNRENRRVLILSLDQK